MGPDNVAGGPTGGGSTSAPASDIDALRRLVAGTAHDLNNLLGVVIGCAALALEDTTLAPATRQLVREVVLAAERAQAIAERNLLPPRATGEVPLVDLNAVLRALVPLLERLCGPDVSVTLGPALAPVWVRADPSAVEQIVFNLVVNARDAMPDGGAISVRATASAAKGGPDQGPRSACLVVTDTGPGIAVEIRDGLFEPHVTTKRHPSRGGGLGLMVVRSTAERLGGEVAVSSTGGQGTTFTITLPLAPAPGSSGGD
ncbi:MAG: HAMP domain-containing sensor histidine kinase [Vicinamibacterales bacterium]